MKTEIKDRLKEIRLKEGLSQKDFAESIKLKQQSYAQYETGRVIPPDIVINMICIKYNINEEWIKGGKDPRDKEMTEKEKLIARIDEVYNGPDDFHKQALHILAEMRPEEIKILQIMADRIIEKRQK